MARCVLSTRIMPKVRGGAGVHFNLEQPFLESSLARARTVWGSRQLVLGSTAQVVCPTIKQLYMPLSLASNVRGHQVRHLYHFPVQVTFQPRYS